MNRKVLLIVVFIICVISSCSVKKYLPEGETLYRGAKMIVIKKNGVLASKNNLQKKLKASLYPKSNKYILGQPYKVWWWYKIGEPSRKKGLKVFLREKLGEPPVFGSRIKPKSIAENMQAFLENEGYFHSEVQSDTTMKNGFITAYYTATIWPQYIINRITWVSDSSNVMQALQAEQQKESVLVTQQGYSLSNITNELSRLDLKLKTKGYYYFNPNYLMAYIDSTIGNNKVDIYLNIKSETPESAKHPYTINTITLYPNYNLLAEPGDTALNNIEVFDNLIIKNNEKFSSKMFKRIVTYRPNSIYDITEQNKTLNRFINLGNFKFVKNVFTTAPDSNGNVHSLDAMYYLSPSKKKSFQGQIDGFSKENKFIGTSLSINWKNRNALKGSELLTIKTYGSLELSYADSLQNNNNYRAGSEVSLTFPQFIIPFFKIKESSFYTPHTRILLGYELLRKQGFYNKNVFRAQYEFNWKETINKEHSFAPIAINYINASNVSQEYLQEATINPAILTNIYSEAILGSFYSFTTNTKNQNANHLWYFNGSIDVSGNIAGLITDAKKTREQKVFNTPFAQFIKGDIELRFLKKIKSNLHWANRLQIGVGVPYNNSNVLPFSKQYIAGGSNSIRGFRIRQIGPGSYLPTLEDQRFYFIIGGDYKFLLNTELRIPILGGFGSAVFIDAGNIWTKDNFLFGKAGQLKKDMYKELAVAGGVGIRYDLKILLIRIDIGMPFRKPYLLEKERWVFDKINFTNANWRTQNLVFNIAIGYPF
jgi:outer membrane protein insertion porin family